MFDVICGQPTENITELRIPTVYEKYVTYTLLDFVGMGKKKTHKMCDTTDRWAPTFSLIDI